VSLLKNKIAVVTGGSSGIGLATTKRFVEEGAYVFIAGRRQAEIDKDVAEIGLNVIGVKTDIGKRDDLDRLYKTVFCSDVDQQTQGTKDQDQRVDPWRGRYANVLRTVPVQGGRRRRHTPNYCDDASGTIGAPR